MSETETHMGKIKEIAIEYKTFAEKTAFVKREYGVEFDEDDGYCDTQDFIVVEGKVYFVLEDKDIEYDEICEGKLNEDGEIEYILKFYNGGTCFSEMMEEAIKRALVTNNAGK